MPPLFNLPCEDLRPCFLLSLKYRELLCEGVAGVTLLWYPKASEDTLLTLPVSQMQIGFDQPSAGTSKP